MNAKLTFSFAASIIVLGFFANIAKADDLSGGDLDAMHSTYKANQARFARDYIGRKFSATIPFYSITESAFYRGTYQVGFGPADSFLSEVDCSISDRSVIDKITDWNKGDQITLSGTVKDHVMGAVVLDKCTFP